MPPQNSKRRKVRKNYSAAIALLVTSGECSFDVLYNLWRTGKFLHPLFASVRFYFDDNMFRWMSLKNINEWKTYCVCYLRRGCVWETEIVIHPSKLMATMLMVYGYVELAHELMEAVELAPRAVTMGVALNGKFSTYQKYMKLLGSTPATTDFVEHLYRSLFRAPLFSTELLDWFNFWNTRTAPHYLDRVIHFLDDVIIKKSPVALDYLLAKLKLPIPMLSVETCNFFDVTTAGSKWLIANRGEMSNVARIEAKRALKGCYQWGHPKAIELAETLLIPLCAE